jgi:hypothetical protein
MEGGKMKHTFDFSNLQGYEIEYENGLAEKYLTIKCKKCGFAISTETESDNRYFKTPDLFLTFIKATMHNCKGAFGNEPHETPVVPPRPPDYAPINIIGDSASPIEIRIHCHSEGEKTENKN